MLVGYARVSTQDQNLDLQRGTWTVMQVKWVLERAR
jgi:DNA invertase Pin-like site-specific DNA recombinase